MELRLGQISESDNINVSIYNCFTFLSEKNQRKFVKKFKAPHTEIQIMHTFRELLLGAYLSANGFLVENDRQIKSKTPDWSICGQLLDIVAIVEMVYHHIDSKINNIVLEN